jgi:DNA-directed RNA polymerase subunit E"
MVLKEQACKKCGYVLEDSTIEECPICQNKKFTTFWKGSVIVNDPENSDVAKKLNITQKGRFALRIN